MNEGDIKLVNNSFKISGRKGRIAELFDVNGSLVSNGFKAALKNSSNTQAIYTDKNSSVSMQNNDSYGF